MAGPKVEDRLDDASLHVDEGTALEMACEEGAQAFIRACSARAEIFAPGHYVVLDPSTLDYATAPTQAEAIEQFARQFPHARGSLHRVGEDL